MSDDDAKRRELERIARDDARREAERQRREDERKAGR